jgi:regulatory protein
LPFCKAKSRPLDFARKLAPLGMTGFAGALTSIQDSDMNPFEEAKQLAINFIDYAPRTRAEVERRLVRAGYEEETIAAVIADLERIGLLNDQEFSALWVESRSRRKKIGSRRLSAELRQKGVSKEVVDEAVSEINEEVELSAAEELARKRLKPEEYDDPPARRRVAAYLQRRGYNWEIIEQVFGRLLANRE